MTLLCALGSHSLGLLCLWILSMEEEARDGRLGGERPRDSFLPRQVPTATLSVFADCFLPFCRTLRKKYCTVPCWYNLALSWALQIRPFVVLILVTKFECATGVLRGL